MTALIVTKVAQSHRIWREGANVARISGGKRQPSVGTTFAFTLNEEASVSLIFTQRLRGRRVLGQCLTQANGNRRQPACKHTVIRGTLSFTGHAGKNEVSFQGRISHSQKLKPGQYTLVITAASATGEHASPKRLSFTMGP